jgi:hypothetical protein
MLIRKAERKKAKLRLGICGASGSGKTRSSLEIASGMGGKIGMIDTEAGRGELYANCTSKYDPDLKLTYDIIRLDAPYSTERYIEAIQSFEKAGYDILIIDSLSHAWSGEGGVLSVVDKAGGQFQNGWKVGTPKQNSLIDAIITSKMHIICNLRVKTEYVVEKNDRGKNEPRKIGLAPVQRDQLEYEFTVFMSMSQEHVAHVTKDNTEMFDQEFIKPSPAMGKKLMEWLNTGIDSKEIFIKLTMPAVLDEIHEIENMNGLKDAYANYYKLYSQEFPEEFEKITQAKDARKEELMESALSSMTPTVIVPAMKSKYSSALTGAVQ